jgi:hypothetical protein
MKPTEVGNDVDDGLGYTRRRAASVEERGQDGGSAVGAMAMARAGLREMFLSGSRRGGQWSCRQRGGLAPTPEAWGHGHGDGILATSHGRESGDAVGWEEDAGGAVGEAGDAAARQVGGASARQGGGGAAPLEKEAGEVGCIGVVSNAIFWWWFSVDWIGQGLMVSVGRTKGCGSCSVSGTNSVKSIKGGKGSKG